MKKPLLLSFVPVWLLMGCDTQMDDLTAFVVEVKSSTAVSVEPYPKFKSVPAFEYSSSQLRSPFERPKSQVMLEPIKTQAKNCLQPDTSKPKQMLEKYGTDSLTLSGTFTSQGRKWALITANDGSLHKATVGSRIGLFFGEIINIENQSVTFTEMLPDGAGCWQKKQARLSMTKSAGEM